MELQDISRVAQLFYAKQKNLDIKGLSQVIVGAAGKAGYLTFVFPWPSA